MPDIVVFGSINLDIIVPVARLPERGETLLGGDAVFSPGGKGANQAHAARLAGAEVAMVGRVGSDGLAEPALALLERNGVDLACVGRSDRATGCATIWNGADGSSTIVVSPGANEDVTADDVPDALLEPGKVLLLQQEVPLAENARLVERAARRGVPVVLNAAPAVEPPDAIFGGVDYLIVNEIELRMIAAAHGLSGEDDMPALLARKLDLTVIATFGDKGVVYTDGSEAGEVAAHPIDVVDTTGAGDTFVGVFAACLARDPDLSRPDLDRAVGLANAAAALSCRRRGAQAAQPRWDDFAAGA